MSRKKAILITVSVVGLVYLFLLVALPALENALLPYSAWGEDMIPSPATPKLMYILPGAIGMLIVAIILKSEKEETK